MTLVQNHRIFYLITIAVFLCLFAAGCTTTSPHSPASAPTLFEPGDRVKIIKKDGQELKFKVSEVSKQGITGDGKFVAYVDMREIWITEFDSEETTKVVLGVTAAAAVGYYFLRELAKGLQSIPAY